MQYRNPEMKSILINNNEITNSDEEGISIDGAFASASSYSKWTSTLYTRAADGKYCEAVYLNDECSSPSNHENWYMLWISEDNLIGHFSKIESVEFNDYHDKYKYSFVDSSRPIYDFVSSGQRVVILKLVPSDITISNNTVQDCGRDGIILYGGGINVDITGNTVDNCGIDFEVSDPGIRISYLYGGVPDGQYGPVFNNTVAFNNLIDCNLILGSHDFGLCPDNSLRPYGNVKSNNNFYGSATASWISQYGD